jgi:hypothetical protein
MEDIDKYTYLELDRPAMMGILGNCATNPGFLRGCAKALDPKYINDPIISDLYSFVISYYNKYAAPPTRHEVDSYISTKFPDLNSNQRYRQVFYESVDLHAKNFRPQALEDNISAWLKVVELRKTIRNSANLFNSKNYNESAKEVQRLIAKLKDAEFDRNEKVDMSTIEDVINNLVTNRDLACTLGHPLFDELLLDNARIRPQDPGYDSSTLSGQTRGCLLPEEQTILMGPSNAGKTTTVSTIAVSNIAMKKKVCLITCEDPKEKMMVKLMQSFCQVKMLDLNYTKTEEFQKLKREWVTYSEKYLAYFEHIKAGKMYVEDVIDVIVTEQEKQVNKDGKGFDLVIVDYPGILMSREQRNKDEWQEKRYIYSQFKLLAKAHKWHSFVPIQTNREGFKNNAESGRLLDLDSIAQGFGIATDADNVITINRDENDHRARRVKFFIAKSRSNRNKTTFVSETKYDLGRTHGLNYGCFVVEPQDLAKAKDDEYITSRMPIKQNSEILKREDPGRVAYNMAPSPNEPPADRNQIKLGSVPPPAVGWTGSFDKNGNKIE